MLVAFYKDFGAEQTVVKVIKFGDRIWVNEDGDIECHREIFLDLSEGNLRKIFMLTSFRHIVEPEDMTDTFLKEDYSVNKKSSGEYKLVNVAKKLFSVDYIDNIYAVPIRSFQTSLIGDCSYLEVIFNQEIQAPIKFAMRLKFKVNSLAEKLEEDNYLLKLNYFHSRACENECNALNVYEREIKAKTILDMKTRSGGFDILIHLPYGAKNIDPSEKCHRTQNTLDAGGKEGPYRHECIWHMREFHDNEVGKEIGTNSGSGYEFRIIYNMISFTERMSEFRKELMEENKLLKEDIGNLRSNNETLHEKVRKGEKLQIISIIVALIAIILAIIIPLLA